MNELFQNLCRPQYCSSGEIQASCHCIQPFTQLSGMPVALMVKVTSRKDGSDSLTSGQLRKLHTTLENSLEAIAVNTTAEIATTLYVQQENATSLTYLTIVIAYSDWGTDTKLAMRPFLRYLDTDEVLDLNIGKLHLSAILTTNARLWTEFDGVRGTFKACCLDQQPNQLVEVYANKDVVNSGNNIGYGIYQPMSRLLYCKQVELNQTEHCITDSGILYINATEPMIATSDYHSVSESQVRVCADVYVPKASRKAKTSVGALCGCSVEVMIINLLSVVVTCMIY